MSRKTRKAVALTLEATLKSLRAYRKIDPNYERAVADCVNAEALLPHSGGQIDGLPTHRHTQALESH